MLKILLLAPVPLEHLQDGIEVCNVEGKVAFGSRAWEIFRELDKARSGLPVDVYIYASRDERSDALEVSWRGEYIGHVESMNGAHPQGMRFRPPSTGKYAADNKGHWAVFWEVRNLQEIPVGERVGVRHFKSYRSGKSYKRNFVPEGPLLVSL